MGIAHVTYLGPRGVLRFLVVMIAANLWWTLLQTPPVRHTMECHGMCNSMECFAMPSGNTTTSHGAQSKVLSMMEPPHEVPIVVISALRPQYLAQVLESLDSQHQHANTPSWMANTPRYLFVHRHELNNKKTEHDQVLALANQYNYTVHHFDGLYERSAKMNINANFVWYRMMRFLFGKEAAGHLHVEEALIIEDDAVLAPDGLLVASRLLLEKWRRNDVHAVTLGGHSGANKVNPDPHTYLAVLSLHFQAMAYSLNASLFEQIQHKKKEELLRLPFTKGVADWSEEITASGFIENLVMLSPSVGRMHHIGSIGLGRSGRGNETREVLRNPHWSHWKDELSDPDKQLLDYYLEPENITDVGGYLCEPLRSVCRYSDIAILDKPVPRYVEDRYLQGTHQMRPGTVLGPRLRVMNVSASSSLPNGPPEFAVDGDFRTRWISRGFQRKQKPLAWLELDLGVPLAISSMTIYWENAYATEYIVTISDNRENWKVVQNVVDGKGLNDFFSFTRPNATLGRYIRINFQQALRLSWGYSIWEIVVRGGPTDTSVRS